MITIIMYFIHYYIMPQEFYSGEHCLEEWLNGIHTWNAILETSITLDIILGVCGIIIGIWKLFEIKTTSSKTQG